MQKQKKDSLKFFSLSIFLALFLIFLITPSHPLFAAPGTFQCTCNNAPGSGPLICDTADTSADLDAKCTTQCTIHGGKLTNAKTCTSGGTTPAPATGGWLTDPLGLFTGPAATPETVQQAPVRLATRIVSSILLILGAGAFVMFLYGGAMYLFSAGSSKAVETGKNVLVYASIGLVIIFGSYAILSFIFKVLIGT